MDYLVTILGTLETWTLDLGLQTLTYVGDLVTSIVILSGVLGIYPKTRGCLFALCAVYCDYTLCLQSGIHLYTIITLPNFCEDLMHLKLGFLKRFIIFACLVSIQRMRILHWLIMSNVGFSLVRRFFCIAFTSCFRIASSSPPIFFNFKNLLPPFQDSSCFSNLNRFHNKLGLRSMHFQKYFHNQTLINLIMLGIFL